MAGSAKPSVATVTRPDSMVERCLLIWASCTEDNRCVHMTDPWQSPQEHDLRGHIAIDLSGERAGVEPAASSCVTLPPLQRMRRRAMATSGWCRRRDPRPKRWRGRSWSRRPPHRRRLIALSFRARGPPPIFGASASCVLQAEPRRRGLEALA